MNSNKKLLIIYLYPYIFRKFHWEQNELKYYKQFADIEIHELYKIEHPHISSFAKVSFAEDKYIKTFSSFREWKLNFLNIISHLLSIFTLYHLYNSFFHYIFKLL